MGRSKYKEELEKGDVWRSDCMIRVNLKNKSFIYYYPNRQIIEDKFVKECSARENETRENIYWLKWERIKKSKTILFLLL